MKRFFLFVLLLLVIGGAGAAWWYTRETPLTVMHDAIVGLGSLRTAQEAVLDVAWTDSATKATTGFTASLQLNAKNLSIPQGLGVLRLGAKSVQDQDQFFDLVIDADGIALRPQDVTPQTEATYRDLVMTTSSDPFAKVSREIFLKTYGYAGAISVDKDADIRQLIPSLEPAMYAASGLEFGEVNGRKTVAVNVRFLRESFQPFMIALAKAWRGSIPLTAKDYAFVNKLTDDVLAGDFKITLDDATRQLLRIEGSWPDIEQGQDTGGRVRFSLDLDQLNTSVKIAMPKDAVDVTAKLIPGSVPNSLTAAGTREGYVAPTTTQLAPAAPHEIDAFSKYYDSLKKRGLIGAVKKKK